VHFYATIITVSCIDFFLFFFSFFSFFSFFNERDLHEYTTNFLRIRKSMFSDYKWAAAASIAISCNRESSALPLHQLYVWGCCIFVALFQRYFDYVVKSTSRLDGRTVHSSASCMVHHLSGFRILGCPNHTQRYKRFATASTLTQVVVLPWRYVKELAPQSRYTLRRNMASKTKGLVLL